MAGISYGDLFGGGTFRPVRLGQSLNKKPDHSGQTLNFKPDTVYTWVGFLAPRGILHLGQLYLVKKYHTPGTKITQTFLHFARICCFASAVLLESHQFLAKSSQE